MVDWIQLLPMFLLVFVRMLAFLMTMPLFSYRNIPAMFKVGIALFLAWILTFSLEPEIILFDGTYVILIMKEILVGLMVGLIAMVLLYAIQAAGAFIDVKIGFLIANIVDPQTGAQSPLIGSYLYTFALLFMLATNGHHLLIDGMYYSYQFIPLNQPLLNVSDESMIELIATTLNTMFIIAFQMAFPLVGSLFLVDVALGMVSRAVPQMNVFVVGMPLKILVGLPLLMIFMGVFFMSVSYLFERMLETMRAMMAILGGT